MIGVLGNKSALQGYTGPGTTWANKINFVLNHTAGAGSFARPVDQQSSALPLSYGCPHLILSKQIKVGKSSRKKGLFSYYKLKRFT